VSVVVVIKVSTYKGHNTVLLLKKKEYIYKTFIEIMFNEDPVEDPYDESQRKPIWWYHSDHLGSSSYITDNFGRPSHYYEYLPFGELMTEHNQSKYYLEPYPTQNMDSYNNPYKFNDFGGKSERALPERTARSAEMDRETGMYYYGARYYDPRVSIFISVDPLAEQTMEPYLYTGNNPIMFTDPTGMSKEHDFKLNKNGSMTMIRETTDESHTIFNHDMSNSITIDGKDMVHFDKFDLSSNSYSESNYSPKFSATALGKSQVYQFVNPESSDDFYRFSAKFSDVEFGKFDGYFDGNYAGFVFTNNRSNTVSNIGLAKSLSSQRYEGIRFSHSHPSGSQNPSGYH